MSTTFCGGLLPDPVGWSVNFVGAEVEVDGSGTPRRRVMRWEPPIYGRGETRTTSMCSRRLRSRRGSYMVKIKTIP